MGSHRLCLCSLCGYLFLLALLFPLLRRVQEEPARHHPRAGHPCLYLWHALAIAQASWFVATTQLGLVVAYPLVASGPSLVGSLWGALVFREIRGSRNVVLLFVASILLVISATLITLSRS